MKFKITNMGLVMACCIIGSVVLYITGHVEASSALAFGVVPAYYFLD